MTDLMNANQTGQPDGLRPCAEESIQEEAPPPHEHREAPSPEETLRLISELRVHQNELEMRNEELQRKQAQLEASRARCFDLYDLAPAGCLTVSEQGTILEANLAVAALLGAARGALVGQPFFRYVLPEDQDACSSRRKQVVDQGAPQDWDMRMVRADAVR